MLSVLPAVCVLQTNAYKLLTGNCLLEGSISLGSSNPFDQPLVDPSFLNSDFELFAFHEGIASIRRFVSAPAWKDYVIGPAGPLANVTTDAELDDFIRNSAGSTCHLVGSVAMSAPNANYGALNPDLRLKGASGIRVADASIFVCFCRFKPSVFMLTQWIPTAFCTKQSHSSSCLCGCRKGR